MKLLAFDLAGRRHTGVADGESVVDVTDLVQQLPVDTAALYARGIEPATTGLMRWAQAGAAARLGMAAQVHQRLAAPQTARLPQAGNVECLTPSEEC